MREEYILKKGFAVSGFPVLITQKNQTGQQRPFGNLLSLPKRIHNDTQAWNKHNLFSFPMSLAFQLLGNGFFLCMRVHRLEKMSGSHTTKFSTIEQKHGCFSYLPTIAALRVSSVSIPIKCREVTTLPRVTFWEESSSTNAVLKKQEETKQQGEVSW